MQVEQFYNRNQFVITGNGATVFQSYASTCAEITKNGILKLGKDWDYSNTTRKHLYLFINEFKNRIEAFQYGALFHRGGGLFNAKNKRAFLCNLIKQKVIKVSL